MEIKHVILTRGIQGSGKSTWAMTWVKSDPKHRIRINWDCLRNMFGEYWVEDREKLDVISDMTDAFLKAPMEKGWDIVIDNMNLSPKSWKYAQDKIDEYNKIHTKYQYELQFKDFFDVTLEECIRRDSLRPNPIGEAVLRRTYRQYRTFIATELSKKYVNGLKKYDKTKKNCILVDMDATLCFNTTGRPFFGHGAAEGMKDDIPCMEICHLVNNYILDDSVEVIILTGREDTPEIRKATEQWLNEHLIGNVDKILMRPLHDNQKGQDCKLNIYKTFVEPKYNVLFVLEDSSKVVKMWRDNGIVCLQVNDGTM